MMCRLFGFSLRSFLTYGGWLISALLCTLLLLLLPRLHSKILEQPPDWNAVMKSRQHAMASHYWKDERPLTILLGDSQVELGDWYNLFNGSLAVRNCGLSMAVISDVMQLGQAVPDKNPHAIVLMCGINNLLHDQSIDSALRDYEALLTQTVGRFPKSRILVLAVLPVRPDFLGTRTRGINDRIMEFNMELQKLCHDLGIRFLSTSKRLLDGSGGLDIRLTNDGLHLNRYGYEILSSELIKPIVESNPVQHE